MGVILREEYRLQDSENSVRRKVVGPKRKVVAGDWRRRHNGERHYLHSVSSIIRIIKSRKMRREAFVARVGENSVTYNMWDRDHFGDISVEGRIILK